MSKSERKREKIVSLNEENGASSTVFDAGLELIKADFHLHTQKDKEFWFARSNRQGI